MMQKCLLSLLFGNCLYFVQVFTQLDPTAPFSPGVHPVDAAMKARVHEASIVHIDACDGLLNSLRGVSTKA